MDFGYEGKFLADATREDVALAWLTHTCGPDPKYTRGTVSSIYYDTPALGSYREKRNGDFVKSKVRLRWYDNRDLMKPDETEAFLEVKLRVGSGRTKLRKPLILTREWLNRVALEDDGLRELPYRYGADLILLMAVNLHPAVAVTYDRRRFVCAVSESRVCLDSNIRAARVNSALLPNVRGPALDAAVIEVKSAGIREIPWLGGLYRAGFRHRSFSKYGACISQIIQGATR